MSPVVIEFIGLPGAGKTTIAQHVIDRLSSAGYRCFGFSTLATPESVEKRSGGLGSKMRTLYEFGLSCFLYRRLAMHGLAYTLHVNSLSLVGLRRLFIFLVRLRYVRSLMDDGYDLLVLDQGPVQNVWSITTTGRREPHDKALVPLMRELLRVMSPFVILVDVDAALANERISARTTMRSRFDRMAPDEAKERLARYRDVFTRLVNVSDSFRETGFLEVDGDNPLDENLGFIVPFIEQARRAHEN